MSRATFDRIVFGTMLLLVWQAASVWTGPELISSPLLVGQQLYHWSLNGVLSANAGYTLLAAVLGFVIGGLPGLALPFILRKRPFVTAVLDPFILIGYGLPKVAFIPLFIIWFGIGIWSKVALVASVSFFLVFFSTMEGVRGVDPRLLRMAKVAGASETQLLRTIVWPSALPFIFQAVQVTLPLSIGGAAIAELISSNRGLGYLVQFSAGNFEVTGALAAVTALALVVAVTNVGIDRLHDRLLAWKPPHPKGTSSGSLT
ncbi:ABC transporter permease [Bradyrhizobium sp. DOA9]|uniref:ABC transporter permease n=1 Tax=Bradyrhizobium sp. DOA9 TaxID=1126627 RepID=UPI0005AA9B43|nr:ABC transporter permease [Bradyrhizobium sp. DOA9]GAJ36728.1 taurine transport system permease protein tauC [Bradyrhizobium sp. DOA9]